MSGRARPRSIEVGEFFADPAFADASISPDGRRIAYLAPGNGRMNVWVRRVDEGHEDAVRLTHDTRRGIRTFCWSDDPRWLLYLQDADGDEDWHLHRVDLDAPDQPAVDLTPLPPGSRVFALEPEKAPRGSVLVWMNRCPDRIDLFRVDVATGETALHLAQPEAGATVLLDRGGRAAFQSALTDDGTCEFSAIDRRTGRKRLLRRLGGPEHPLGPPLQEVTPDGSGLLVGTYQDSDHLRLVRIDRDTGAETVVAAADSSSLCTASTPTVLTSRRTGEVIAARFVGDRPALEVLDPHFAEVHAALSQLSDGVLCSASSDETEQRWVATFVGDREPGATWFYDHSTGAARLLFRSHPQLDPADLAPMAAVHFPARDGLALHAFLTLPVGVAAEELPLVLLVHGGPWFHDSWTYHPTVQLLANRGYAVLQVNFRGSTGYGKRHLTAAVGEFAGKMHDDLVDAADLAVAQGFADPNRIAIVGSAYGGYAALAGAALTPGRFAAAVAHAGISNLANFMRTLPPFARPALANSWYRYVGDPADPDREADLLARSPSTMVDRIRTPLLVVQSADDVRVVQDETADIVGSLRERGVAVEHLVAFGEDGPEHQVLLHRAIEEHLVAHLGG